MPSKKHLSPEDREFFSLVRDAAFANPFSDERVELDLRISGVSPGVSDAARVSKVTETVHFRIWQLEEERQARISQFHKSDHALIKTVFLFDFFHQFIDQFDRLIPEQIRTGDTSVRVPFSHDALSLLRKRGFSAKDSLHYYPTAMILAGETCEVLKTSQVFGEPTHHIHCGCVLLCPVLPAPACVFFHQPKPGGAKCLHEDPAPKSVEQRVHP